MLVVPDDLLGPAPVPIREALNELLDFPDSLDHLPSTLPPLQGLQALANRHRDRFGEALSRLFSKGHHEPMCLFLLDDQRHWVTGW